jgi:hypothetical protein
MSNVTTGFYIDGVSIDPAIFNTKADKVTDATAGNIAILDEAGNLADSGANPAAISDAVADVADDLATHAGDAVKHLPSPGGAGNAGKVLAVNEAGAGWELILQNVDLSAYYTKAEIDILQQAQDQAIGGKADDPHTHTRNQVTDLGTAAGYNVGSIEGTVPVLMAGGKIDAALLPAVAITETRVFASEAAMLAWDAQEGDVAVRTDIAKSFIRLGDGSWQELLTPVSPVQSVAGKVGVVVLTTADIEGLSAALDARPTKAVPAAAGNLAALDADGNLIDSTRAQSYYAVAGDLTTHMGDNTRHVPVVNAGTNGKVLVSGSSTTYWSYVITTAATANTFPLRDAAGKLTAAGFIGSGAELTNIAPTQLTGWPSGTSGFLWYTVAGTLQRVTGQTARTNMGAAASGANIDLTSIRNGATGAPGTDGVFEGDGPTDGGIGGNGTNLDLSNGGPGGQGGAAGDDGQTSGNGGPGGNGAVMRLCCGGPGGQYGASGANNYGNIGLGGNAGTIELVCGGLTGEEYTGNAGTLKIALGEGGTVQIGGTIHLQGGTVNIGGEGSTISAFGGPGLNGAIVITGESDSEKLASLLAGLRQIGWVAPAA